MLIDSGREKAFAVFVFRYLLKRKDESRHPG